MANRYKELGWENKMYTMIIVGGAIMEDGSEDHLLPMRSGCETGFVGIYVNLDTVEQIFNKYTKTYEYIAEAVSSNGISMWVTSKTSDFKNCTTCNEVGRKIVCSCNNYR